MKIIIVGAGISGLSTYLFLLHYLPNPSIHEITLIEAYDTKNLPANATNSASILTTTNEHQNSSDAFSTTVIGSALGLSSNGLAVLRRIDADGSTKTLDRIWSKGHPVTKWSINSARGWKLAEVSLVPPSQQDGKSSERKKPTSDGDNLGPALMIVRHFLWECLRDAVVQAGGEILTKRVMSIVVDESRDIAAGNAVTLTFADGTTDTADLVIGADGLKSVVRNVMFVKNKEENGKDYVTPRYEGLCGVAGWLPATVLTSTPLQPGVMALTFGPNGFFGCGYMSTSSEPSTTPSTTTTATTSHPSLAGWWSTYPSPTPPIPSTFSTSSAITALLARHTHWKDPTIHAILRYIQSHPSEPGLLPTAHPTYTSPALPTYTSATGHLVLIGDAAHTLQPSSGQGACQALEDAEAYALLLSYYLQSSASQSPLMQAGRAYTALRRPRINAIYERSQKMGGLKKELNVFTEFLVYFAVWVMTFFKDTYNAQLMNYDVPSEVDRIIKTQASSGSISL